VTERTLERPSPTPPSAGVRTFDGVLCFGGADWWYHNHGHFDIQMMRRLERRVPVLYVNSIGLRVPRPSEGAMFARRILRKLRSWSRGFRPVGDRLAVLSPVSVPGRLGGVLSRSLLLRQVSRAARRMGIRRPLLWVECLPAAEIAEALRPAAVVYQRTDRLEDFPGADRTRLSDCDRRLKALADVTLFVSRHLYERERSSCRSACLVDHGVDLDLFENAARSGRVPGDVLGIPAPRVGFVGGIDDHTFDSELFDRVARSLPDLSFVIVGACTVSHPWTRLPNVHLLGRRPYAEVPYYMAACDVLLMPWKQNAWIEACNPVKLKEYLAAGKPVVSTPFPVLAEVDGGVLVARDPERFALAIRDALRDPHDPEALRGRVRGASWDSRLETVLRDLAARDVLPDSAPGRR